MTKALNASRIQPATTARKVLFNFWLFHCHTANTTNILFCTFGALKWWEKQHIKKTKKIYIQARMTWQWQTHLLSQISTKGINYLKRIYCAANKQTKKYTRNWKDLLCYRNSESNLHLPSLEICNIITNIDNSYFFFNTSITPVVYKV